MLAAQRGEREAFGQLYDRYAGVVFGFVLHRVGERGLAEDLTSETFLRALRGIGSVREQGRDIGAWLITIARNLTADHYKSSRVKLEHTTSDPAPFADVGEDHSPEWAVITEQTAARLRDAVAALPTADQRDCIRLRYLQDLSVTETAAVMGRAPTAVKSLTHRALLGLRAQLSYSSPQQRADRDAAGHSMRRSARSGARPS